MLDTDLFGDNDRPFAAYFEPDGFRELLRLRRPNIYTYQRLLPRTVDLSQRLWHLTPQRSVWGKQIGPGRWTTETEGAPVPVSAGAGAGRTRQGQPLELQDLVKHFAGRTHAVGTCDIRRLAEVWDPVTHEFREVPNAVSYLRLDVDQDTDWKQGRTAAIFDEVHEQRLVAHGLGLPYRVFRTGGRGYQAVLPLPVALPHPLASFLLESYRWLLELRGSSRAVLDADNLHKLMRLPGGTHASNYNLGLWIDIDHEQLHPLEEQVRLMSAGFEYPLNGQPGLWNAPAFVAAGRELLDVMGSLGIVRGAVLKREQVRSVLAASPENPITARWSQARELVHTFRSPHCTAKQHPESGPPQSGESSRGYQASPRDTDEDSAKAAGEEPLPSSAQWAAQVWMDGFEPGGFWDWIRMDGGKGILAAVCLFGRDGAEEQLRDFAKRVLVRKPSDLQDRYQTIMSCWRSFKLKEFVPVERSPRKAAPFKPGEANEEVHELAESIVRQMRARDPKGRWKSDLAHLLVLVLLLALQDSLNGRVEVSYRSLAETINQRWPNQPPTNRMRVKEMLARLIPGDQCLYEMLRRTKGVAAIGQPDRYSPGNDLARTPLGKVWMQRKVMEGQQPADFHWDAEDEDDREVPVALGEAVGER